MSELPFDPPRGLPFYMLKHDRLDLRDRTSYLVAGKFDPAAVPAGSVLVFYANDPHVPTPLTSGTASTVMSITGKSGSPSAIVLRRN